MMRHLVGEAAVLIHETACAEDVYLVVYVTSSKAIALYAKLGFARVGTEPIPDPLEGGLAYWIMARQAVMASRTRDDLVQG